MSGDYRASGFGGECPGLREISEQLRHAVMTLVPILLQQPQNQIFERCRYTASMRRDPVRLVVKNRVGDRDFLIAAEWLPSREHLVQHYAQRPQVRAPIHVFTADLL